MKLDELSLPGLPAPDDRSMLARVDYPLLLVRAALALAALALLLPGIRTRGEARTFPNRARRWGLGGVALLALLVNHHSFPLPGWPDLRVHDAVHYYLGSKYFPELGYLHLYECAVAAGGEPSGSPPRAIRDLRTHRIRRVDAALLGGRHCEGIFTAERGESFRDDVQWFARTLGPEGWQAVLVDHGYNGSPVWTLIGRGVASALPASDLGIWLLTRLDLLLLTGAFAAVAWAFGLEGLCLALIVWALSPLSRSVWIGDSFLHQLWFASSLAGICFLRRGHAAWAGAALTLSALLRIFPVLFLAGYAVAILRRPHYLRAEEARRFAVAAAMTMLLLLAAGALGSGRGASVYSEYAGKIASFAGVDAPSFIGLRPVISFVAPPGEGSHATGKARSAGERIAAEDPGRTLARSAAQLAIVCVALGLLWRAGRRLRPWETTALAFALIPLVTPTNAYYTSYVVAGALLATRRPELAVGLLLAVTAWCLSSLRWYTQAQTQALVSSVVMVLLCIFALLAVNRSTRLSPEGA